MADIDLELITPSAPEANDADVVRRGAGPFSIALVPNVRQEVIDARGSRSSLNLRISTISNYASPNAGGVIVGDYYDTSFHAANTGTVAQLANRLQMSPFFCSTPFSIDQLGIAITTAGTAGTLARCCIYSSNGDFFPDALEYSGALELDVSTTGYKAHTLSFTFESGRAYWIGVNGSGSFTMRGMPSTSCVNFGMTNPDSATYRKGIQRTSVSSGSALPDPFTFTSADLNDIGTAIPTFRMRAA